MTSVADASIQALAQALAGARRSGAPLAMAPWLGPPTLPDTDAAYAVQAQVAALLAWFGPQGPGHWKSGGPSRTAALTHAPLPPAGVRQSRSGQPVDLRDMVFARPLIEVEIALRLGRELSRAQLEQWPRAADGTLVRLGDLLDGMAVSVEVVDSRWSLPPADADPVVLARLGLADQQSHGALALGEWTTFAAHDWSAQSGTLQIGDQPVQSFAGSHPLGDPTWLLPLWLAHATRDGRPVRAGTVVSTGTWSGVAPVAAGDRVQAGVAGIGMLTLQF